MSHQTSLSHLEAFLNDAAVLRNEVGGHWELDAMISGAVRAMKKRLLKDIRQTSRAHAASVQIRSTSSRRVRMLLQHLDQIRATCQNL